MFPTLLHIGPITIHTYGVFVALGFLAGFQYLVRRAVREGIPEKPIVDLVLYALIAGLAGARLMYVLLNLPYYLSAPREIFAIWSGGLVYYGGFIAAALVVILLPARRRKLTLWPLADLLAPALALGHALGRIGCFFAGCCYGAPSSAPWAVVFSNPESFAPCHVPLHPVQLYEAAGNLVLFAGLDRLSRRAHPSGAVFASYLVFYGILRFAVELFRGDERGQLIFSLSTGQSFSLAAIAAGILLFLLRYRRYD